MAIEHKTKWHKRENVVNERNNRKQEYATATALHVIAKKNIVVMIYIKKKNRRQSKRKYTQTVATTKNGKYGIIFSSFVIGIWLNARYVRFVCVPGAYVSEMIIYYLGVIIISIKVVDISKQIY